MNKTKIKMKRFLQVAIALLIGFSVQAQDAKKANLGFSLGDWRQGYKTLKGQAAKTLKLSGGAQTLTAPRIDAVYASVGSSSK